MITITKDIVWEIIKQLNPNHADYGSAVRLLGLYAHGIKEDKNQDEKKRK